MQMVILALTSNEAERVKEILKEHWHDGEGFYTMAQDNSDILIAGFQILYSQHRVLYNTKEILLSPKEFDVLYLLLRNPDRVFSREQILETAGSEEAQDEDNAVRCLIAGIRKKLRTSTGKDYIQTVRGVGYRFVIPEQ